MAFGELAATAPAQKSTLSRISLRGFASGLLHDVVTTLFPGDCRVCERPLVRAGRAPVCDDCLAVLEAQRGLLCAQCGEAFDVDMESDRFHERHSTEPAVCTLCREAPPPFTQAVAYGTYETTLRELVHLLKYEGVTALAEPLGARLADSLSSLRSFAGEPSREWLVAPVPLARGKARDRGFNQALLLARAAVRHWERAGGTPRLLLRPDLLQRTRATESQFGLTPHQRRANLRGAFAVTAAAGLNGRSVLLIDDIYTTGATARACSAVLRRAGASEVVVATLARAQTPTVALWDGTIAAAAVFPDSGVSAGQ